MNKLSGFVSVALLAAASMAAAQSGPANPNPAAVEAGNYAIEGYHTRVQFSVSHIGFTDWYGDFSGVTGTLQLDPKNLAASKLDISIPVASVSTTNGKLDDELKSPAWFGAEAFPTIHFVSTKIVSTGPKKADIIGNLTFHGVTKPVVLKATFNGAGVNPLDKSYTVGFNATTILKRSDFGVKTYLPLIGDTTDLRISAAFVKAR